MENLDALKTNQPKSTVELCYMCPRGLTGPPTVTLTKKLKYIKRDFYTDTGFYTILSRDLNSNMDHMLISGTEPSSVILSQPK